MTDAMARTFRPLEPLKGWRRVAVQAWRPPHDPSVYATLDVPMGPALAYLERLRAETGARVTRLRQRRDRQVERTKSILDRLPLRLLGPFLRIVSYLVYDLDLDLSRFGVVKDEFGSAMVTNVGTFGLAHAYAPLVPFSRTPLVVLVGEVQDRPVVEDGRVVARPIMTLGVTFDHRFMDGFQGGAMAQLFRAFLEDPARFDRLEPEPATRPAAMPSPRN